MPGQTLSPLDRLGQEIADLLQSLALTGCADIAFHSELRHHCLMYIPPGRVATSPGILPEQRIRMQVLMADGEVFGVLSARLYAPTTLMESLLRRLAEDISLRVDALLGPASASNRLSPAAAPRFHPVFHLEDRLRIAGFRLDSCSASAGGAAALHAALEGLGGHRFLLADASQYDQHVAGVVEPWETPDERVFWTRADTAPLAGLRILRRRGARIAIVITRSDSPWLDLLANERPDALLIPASWLTRDLPVTLQLAELADRSDCRLIATDAETPAELDCLRACGIPLVQGLYLGLPLWASEMGGSASIHEEGQIENFASVL